ncbi:hypothetical protein SDC9_172625 [bioreactor metagenome]|uniref:Uncharacterized protein n=1 Tax=bioreactor metagenome TaxID=1076179 RepID=A0A645GE95_9ZZZZ
MVSQRTGQRPPGQGCARGLRHTGASADRRIGADRSVGGGLVGAAGRGLAATALWGAVVHPGPVRSGGRRASALRQLGLQQRSRSSAGRGSPISAEAGAERPPGAGHRHGGPSRGRFVQPSPGRRFQDQRQRPQPGRRPPDGSTRHLPTGRPRRPVRRPDRRRPAARRRAGGLLESGEGRRANRAQPASPGFGGPDLGT